MAYLKYPAQVLKIICINLVRLITLVFGPAALHPWASASRVYLSQERFISFFQGDRQEMEPLILPLNCAL